jgi:hypothetical protein
MSNIKINQLPSGIANPNAVVAADNADLTTTEKIKLGDIAKLATDEITSKYSIKNVYDYGAVGDGVADDTQAIANTIASVSSGGTIFFPAGTYKTTPLSFSNLSKITIMGEGKSSILKVNTPGHCFIFDDSCTNIELYKLLFQGSCLADSFPRGYALQLSGPGNVIKECSFQNFNCGILVLATQNSLAENCRVINCNFTDIVGLEVVNPPGSNGYGILTTGKRTIVSGNSFVNVGRHDVYLSAANLPSGGAQYCVVQSNVSNNSQNIPVALNSQINSSSSFHIIDGNTIYDNKGSRAIAISNNSCDNVISNNTIIRSSGFGIALEGGQNINEYPNRNIITGNNIRDTANIHINCINGSDNIFSDNIVSSINISPSFTRGIQIGDNGSPTIPPSGNVIGENIYYGLPDAPFISPHINNITDQPFGLVTMPVVQTVVAGATILEAANTIFISAPNNNYSLTLPIPNKGKRISIIRTDSSVYKIGVVGTINNIEYSYSTSDFFPISTPNKRLTLISDGNSWYSI